MRNIFLIAVFLLCGCAIANLRLGHGEGDFTTVDQNKGRDILKEVALKAGYIPENNYNHLDVTLVDNWSWTLLRWLTPVRSNHQKLHFTFGLKDIDVLMAYLDGPGVGDTIGIKDGQTFKNINGRLFKKNFKDVEIYCLHLRRYFLWPYVLAKMPVVAFLGEGRMNGQSYDLVFTGVSANKANSKEDQYIIWVNQQSKQVDYIEFTSRHLLSSFQAIVAYKDYRDAGGVRFAYDITLLSNFHSNGFAHHLVAQSIELH
jgi:hypothetical protein